MYKNVKKMDIENLIIGAYLILSSLLMVYVHSLFCSKDCYEYYCSSDYISSPGQCLVIISKILFMFSTELICTTYYLFYHEEAGF